MKKYFIRLIATLLSAATTTVMIIGTGCGGTATGNPPSLNSNIDALAAVRILDTTCAKITACFTSLSVVDCRTGVLAQNNLAEKLGLPVGFGTYQAIIDAENSGTIHAHATAEQTCLSDLQDLNCNDPTVQSAYSSSAPNDFNHIDNLIPTRPSSCKGLY